MGNKDDMKLMIESGKTALGLEFGSTRIKAVLVDEEHNPIAPMVVSSAPYLSLTSMASFL